MEYVYTASSLPGIPAGAKDRDEIEKVTRNTYVVKASGHRYERVP